MYHHPRLHQTAHARLTCVATQRCTMLDLLPHACLCCIVSAVPHPWCHARPCRARRTAMMHAPLTLLYYNDDPIVVEGGEEGWECRELSVKRW